MSIFLNPYTPYFAEASCPLIYTWPTKAKFCILANYMPKCQMSLDPNGSIFTIKHCQPLNILNAFSELCPRFVEGGQTNVHGYFW